jgi:uncharacterized protein
MSLYHATAPQLSRMLKNLLGWLDKAEAHAAAKKFDAQVLVDARLAPDQFALVRQVQIACDHAKNTAARVSGKVAPAHPDTEKTLAELRARVQTVLAYLADFTEADFAGAEARAISLPVFQGKSLSATHYVYEYGLPNFYFHLVTAYAILRHNGVDVGKLDYIGVPSLQ